MQLTCEAELRQGLPQLIPDRKYRLLQRTEALNPQDDVNNMYYNTGSTYVLPVMLYSHIFCSVMISRAHSITVLLPVIPCDRLLLLGSSM